MTYRKLFLWLLTGSTLLLAAVWHSSHRRYTTLGITSRPFEFQASLDHGTLALRLDLQSDHAAVFGMKNDSFERPAPFFPRIPNRWSFHVIPMKQTGRRDLPVYSRRPRSGFRWRSAMASIYYLEVPMWVPWLFFVSGAFGACRWMEKRSRAAAEKNRAEGEEAGAGG